MPVYKYKSFEAASAHLEELTPLDPFERLSKLQYILESLMGSAKDIPRGVFRFATLEEANKHSPR